MCASGHRGALAQMYLQFLGYTNIRNLGGGLNGWIAAGARGQIRTANWKIPEDPK